MPLPGSFLRGQKKPPVPLHMEMSGAVSKEYWLCHWLIWPPQKGPCAAPDYKTPAGATEAACLGLRIWQSFR